jgi:hypothetical protein
LSELTDTEAMIALLDGPEGADLVVAFLADMGGDPEEYGVDDVLSVTPEQLGVGFKEFLGVALERPELIALVASDEVDWARVVSYVEANLSGFFGV